MTAPYNQCQQTTDGLRQALDAIQAQCDEMRSLKGWRMNLIRENLAKAKATLIGVAQRPANPNWVASETFGPNGSGYYTASIDILDTFDNGTRAHHNAIEFHSKDKAIAESRRDAVLASSVPSTQRGGGK